MKKISQSIRASKEVIDHVPGLSETEKKEKLKFLRKEHGVKIQSILSSEHKNKLWELKLRLSVNK